MAIKFTNENSSENLNNNRDLSNESKNESLKSNSNKKKIKKVFLIILGLAFFSIYVVSKINDQKRNNEIKDMIARHCKTPWNSLKYSQKKKILEEFIANDQEIFKAINGNDEYDLLAERKNDETYKRHQEELKTDGLYLDIEMTKDLSIYRKTYIESVEDGLIMYYNVQVYSNYPYGKKASLIKHYDLVKYNGNCKNRIYVGYGGEKDEEISQNIR